MSEKLKFLSNKIVLYLDTSEPEAVLAMYKNGELKKEIRWLAHRELSLTLSVQYQKLLNECKLKPESLTDIVVFAGPGSFTGLRIGISFANGLAYALGVPIYETRQKSKIELKNPQEIVTPFYGSEPKITTPKTK